MLFPNNGSLLPPPQNGNAGLLQLLQRWGEIPWMLKQMDFFLMIVNTGIVKSCERKAASL